MNEQFKGEQGPAPEKIDDPKYAELHEAMDEEDRILKEIEKVLATAPDRAEAERIVLKEYAPRMDEAMKKSREALDEWLRSIQEIQQENRE